MLIIIILDIYQEKIIEDNNKVDQKTFKKALDNLDKITYFYIERSAESFKELKNILNIKIDISNFLHCTKIRFQDQIS